jgi:hypothetical protein
MRQLIGSFIMGAWFAGVILMLSLDANEVNQAIIAWKASWGF